MKAFKTVVYSFFLGGLFALIAQAILTVLTAWWADTPLSVFQGGGTLLAMGIIGCVLGGFCVYQYLGDKATFGSYLPFSGFAMAVGMKMIVPWTKGESLGKSIWPGLWLVIWFNAVGAIVCILFGFICQSTGIYVEPTAAKTTVEAPLMVYPAAFLMGGILCAVFEACWQALSKVYSGAKHVHILMFAWMVGAVIAAPGWSGDLMNIFGEGFGVMIPVGGYNMFNVGVDFALGGEYVAEGLLHLGTFMGAVAGLFFTGLFTFLIYKAKFGRTPVAEVRTNRAKGMIEDLQKPAGH